MLMDRASREVEEVSATRVASLVLMELSRLVSESQLGHQPGVVGP